MDLKRVTLEDFVKDITKVAFTENPVSMACAAMREDGTTAIGYYNASAQDMAVFCNHLQRDMVMKIIEDNADIIKEILEDSHENH